jgi:pimeloyl-ACP methyl ester carboxylesterase
VIARIRTALLAIVLSAGTVGFTAPESPRNVACRAERSSVVAAGGPQSMVVHACLPTHVRDTLLVAVPGGTYLGSYWDFRVEPSTYSFAGAANRAGYATLTLDPLGRGDSTRPASAALSAQEQAAAIEQVIRQARRGELLEGHAFRSVVLLGHSLGSMEAVLVAIDNADVDGLVLSGFSHELGPAGAAGILARFQPAPLDPALGAEYQDPGYLTTATGERAAAFYSPGQVAPEVLTADEATKSVFSSAEMMDGVPLTVMSPLSTNLRQPVLLANGQYDAAFCGPSAVCDAGTLRAREAPYFAGSRDFATYVLPGAGHDLNLMVNTRLFQIAALDWIMQRFI